MERNGLLKFIYEDAGQTKVLKGFLLEEAEFTYKIKAFGTGEEITLGKRGIIKIYGGGQ